MTPEEGYAKAQRWIAEAMEAAPLDATTRRCALSRLKALQERAFSAGK